MPTGDVVCSWSYCDEEQDKCISSWTEGEPCCITTTEIGVYSPEEHLLRRYRDEVLAGNFFGNRFVHVYYFLSPLAVKLLDRSPLLQHMTMRSFRVILPFVEWHLKKNSGAEN